ncbi:transmembrane protease serine 9-like isoform X1 [Penaeus japonicus]|uniref:transmembrane protease serine 9-like isoform X1 n=1 Tax=Penaeus japonicus TaxID=27405 RepID=UPI001C715691|nr:transmembrane protease serine 9-like isoform X1 [Penaeus japonicus]
MKLWVALTVAVALLALLDTVEGGKGRRKAKRRHAKKMASLAKGPEVRPWGGWRRWWEQPNEIHGATESRTRRPHHGAHYLTVPPESGSKSRAVLDTGSGSGATRVSSGLPGDLADLQGGLYSQWSKWSRCSRRCKQRRQRSCRVPAVCGTGLLKEERSCRGGRCSGRRPFHIIKPEEFTRQPPRNDMRVLLNFNSMFYTRWSRWSACSRSCLTRRYRSCKYPLFCGGSVVNEEAYCYVEGSLCEKWYRRSRYHPRKHQTAGTNDEEDDRNTVSSSSSPSSSTSRNSPSRSPSSPYSSSSPTSSSASSAMSRWADERTLPRKCGVSNVTTPGWNLRIIGGREAQKGKWPWQVVILNRFQEAFCGGTLVGSRWVLTAAHCVRRKLFVRLGEHDLALREGAEVEYKVSRTVIHPKYDSTTVDNDVALLQLPEPVATTPRIAPACLPEQGANLPVGDKCTIIGWGKERNTHLFGTDVLHEAEVVPIIASKICEAVYEDYYITSNMFCAGYLKGRVDSCAGDSGGPLLCQRHGRWYIYGITSFGEGCGKKGKFGIYARVSNYRHWIQSVVATPDL